MLRVLSSMRAAVVSSTAVPLGRLSSVAPVIRWNSSTSSSSSSSDKKSTPAAESPGGHSSSIRRLLNGIPRVPSSKVPIPFIANPVAGDAAAGGTINADQDAVTEVLQTTLAAYPTAIVVPVQWGEMDTFHHVNNVMYIRYFESSRVHYFAQLMPFLHEFSRKNPPAPSSDPAAEHPSTVNFMSTNGIGPILATIQCQYKMPVEYPDTLIVATRADVEWMDKHPGCDRFRLEHTVFSMKTRRIAAQGDGWVVTYDYRRKQKVEAPEAIRYALHALERHSYAGSTETKS